VRLVALLILVLALPLAAGCGGEEDDAGGDGAPPGQSVQVSATDFAFDPSEITVGAGEVSIDLTNDGESPHAIEVEGNGVEEASETINGGDSTTLTVDLDEGTYTIYCPVGDHRDRGMEGTLTVGSGGAGSGGGGTTTDGETETGDDTTTHDETETEHEDEGEDDDSGSGGGGGGYGY
jgi:plastocyanin